MKKIFMALAAVAAFVGCSKENAPIDVIEKNNFTVNASIVLDDTRVAVEHPQIPSGEGVGIFHPLGAVRFSSSLLVCEGLFCL